MRVDDASPLSSRPSSTISLAAPAFLGTVIVNPPRTGLSRDALTALIARAPKRLVYVSCDPATLARDTRSLLDSGHQLLSVAGFDLFPNTPHVEALAIFDRAS